MKPIVVKPLILQNRRKVTGCLRPLGGIVQKSKLAIAQVLPTKAWRRLLNLAWLLDCSHLWNRTPKLYIFLAAFNCMAGSNVQSPILYVGSIMTRNAPHPLTPPTHPYLLRGR
jgi:hypothetical protein